ncbi:hypothetical protein K443DRAFT_677401 [Laccaria amethystina LaAM-08-1]|uniref:Copper transport protein n=1 Tax=Laccaria amethystina LaAM-08-1 TaxID=1095629 RepID=A0A0C9XY95_9AGAR|nr:hypothetical protein K443DRAFT_677401 [Laccaria amethystina LaAM-08-1]
MNHGTAHAGHNMPTGGGGPRCSMNMLWNTDIINTCVVFRSWHIHTHTQFVLSLLAIILLGVFYEYLRVVQRGLDRRIALGLSAAKAGKIRVQSRGSSPASEGAEGLDDPLLGGRNGRVVRSALNGTPVPPVSRALRAALYGATVFLSFFLMLVFMTYNAYLITAVVVGAALGHYIFGATINVDAILVDTQGGKGMACH